MGKQRRIFTEKTIPHKRCGASENEAASMKLLGQHVKAARIAQGLSIIDFARKINTSVRTIWYLEKGMEYVPSGTVALALTTLGLLSDDRESPFAGASKTITKQEHRIDPEQRKIIEERIAELELEYLGGETPSEAEEVIMPNEVMPLITDTTEQQDELGQQSHNKASSDRELPDDDEQQEWRQEQEVGMVEYIQKTDENITSLELKYPADETPPEEAHINKFSVARIFKTWVCNG